MSLLIVPKGVRAKQAGGANGAAPLIAPCRRRSAVPGHGARTFTIGDARLTRPWSCSACRTFLLWPRAVFQSRRAWMAPVLDADNT
jgi:hypothetical protein